MRFGELLIILLIVIILFGRDRLSHIMGDLGKGLRSFKKALNEDETAPVATTTTTVVQPTAPAVPQSQDHIQ